MRLLSNERQGGSEIWSGRAREEMRDNENGKLPHGRRPPRLFEASQRPVLLSPLVKTSPGQSLSLSLCDSAVGGGRPIPARKGKGFPRPLPLSQGLPLSPRPWLCLRPINQQQAQNPAPPSPQLLPPPLNRNHQARAAVALCPPCWARTHVSGSRKILDFFVQCARRSFQHPQKNLPKFAPLWFSQTVLNVANANANADARSGPFVYSQLREGERAA